MKSASFASVAVLTLALGIGSTTAMFSIVSAVLWQPLPYPNAARIVQIVENVPAEESFSGRAMRLASMSPDEFDWWRQNARSIAAMAVAMPDSRTIMTSDGTVLLAGQKVSPALFTIKNVQPLLGRGMQADEERPDAHVVVLGSDTWRRYFAGDATILDRDLTLSGEKYTVVGVMPSEFGDEAYWIPYAVAPSAPGSMQLIRVSSMLREGVSVEAATAEITALGARLRGSGVGPGGPPRFEVVLEQAQMVAAVRPALRVLIVAVFVVLLIVCANVTNLLLVKGAGRHREIGIRRALGAARGRIVRLLLIEGLILSLAGGVLGTILAYGAVQVVKAISIIQIPGRFRYALGPLGTTILPRADEVRLDPTVLAFALGISLVTGLVFALAPAFRLSRSDHRAANGATGLTVREGMPSRRSNRVGYSLAIMQLGLATALLIGGGLLLHSFLKLSSVFLGFDPNTQIFQLVVPREYSRAQKMTIAYDIRARLQALPGIEAAGFINTPPFVPASMRGTFIPVASSEKREQLGPDDSSQTRAVSPGYLQALGVRVLEGRWLTEHDGANQQRVLIVNRAWVKRFSPDKSPIGLTVTSSGARGRQITWEIVGVVDDLRLRMDDGPQSQPGNVLPLVAFMDLRQVLALSADRMDDPKAADLDFLLGGDSGLGFAIRSRGGSLTLRDVRRVVHAIDPASAVEDLATMQDVFWGIIGRQRFYTVVVGTFGTIAGLIAAIGIYGVLAYAMTQRTQEFGIRLALGAQPRKVLRLVLGHGGILVMIGIGLGVAGALAITRYLSSMLFGLTAVDPLTYVAVAGLFAAVALIACYLPARRATKVDPVVALRYE
jgi:putative ABC transport system permease protein